MTKRDRISALVETLGSAKSPALDPHYVGFFTCFNRGEYYEAHDVLEQLWLRTQSGDRDFFQALIQVAGAFVHLRKQFLRPDHPKDGKRLRPAARLFHLAMRNMEPFAPAHLQLDVAAVHALCAHHAGALIASGFTRNPWHPARLPGIELMPAA